MAEYLLTAEEVLYLAAVAGADMFYGVPDTLSGLSDQELRLKVTEMEESLGDKGYLDEDFDGNKSVASGLMEIIEDCGRCERFLYFEKSRIGEPDYTCVYFLRGGKAWKMVRGDNHVFSETRLSDIRREVRQGMVLKAADRKAGDEFGISVEDAGKAATLARRGSADKGSEIFMDAGASQLLSQAVINGILNKSDYYALLFMDMRSERDPSYSVQILSGETLVAMECFVEADEDFVKFSLIDDAALGEMIKAGFAKIGCTGGDEQFE